MLPGDFSRRVALSPDSRVKMLPDFVLVGVYGPPACPGGDTADIGVTLFILYSVTLVLHYLGPKYASPTLYILIWCPV